MSERKARKKEKKDERQEENRILKETRNQSFFGFGKYYDEKDSRIFVTMTMPDGKERRGINFGHPLVGRLFYGAILLVIVLITVLTFII